MAFSNLKSIVLGASNQITINRARFYTLHVVSSAAAGYVRLRDGGSTGNVVFEVATPASAITIVNVELPKEGILCESDLYAELSNVTSATISYDGALLPVMELAAGGFITLTTGALLEPAA